MRVSFFRSIALATVCVITLAGGWFTYIGLHTASASENEAAVRLTKEINNILGGVGEARFEVSTDSLYIHIHSNRMPTQVDEFVVRINDLIEAEPKLKGKNIWLDYVDPQGKVASSIHVKSKGRE